MPTGALEFNCDVCRLNVLGVCSSCGPEPPGGSAKDGGANPSPGCSCPPILECACNRAIDYCLRDCEEFPCERFGAYPFSEGYLTMQERRRSDAEQKLESTKEKIHVPPHYWEDLRKEI